MKITSLELKVVKFDSEDVIATSMYFVNTGSSYRYIAGNMMYYDPDAKGWAVNETAFLGTPGVEDIEYFKANGEYYPDYYDAYMYNDGIYTKGASYYDLYLDSHQ